MKQISIILDRDPEFESQEDFDKSCVAHLMAQQSYDALQQICRIIMTYDKHGNNHSKNLTKKQLELLEQLQRDLLPYFKGIDYVSNRKK